MTARRQTEAAIFGSAAALLLGLYIYAPTLRNWLETFNTDPSYSHGWALPFISGYFVYRTLSNPRGQLLRAQSGPDVLGLVVLVFGSALFLFAQRAAIIFLADLSFLVVLAGVVVALFGRTIMRSLAFPYGILFFGLPLPALLYLPLTFRLQLTSSVLAERALDVLRVPALREGNIIVLPNVRLEVVEACSGVHSLFALLAIACVIGYVFIPNNLGRALLTLTAIPIAILLNAARVTLMGVTCYMLGPAYAEGFAHFSVGLVIFGVACLLILILGERLSGFVSRPRASGTITAAVTRQPSARFSARMLLPALILGVTLLLNLHAARTDAAVPLRRPWAYFPLRFGDWKGRELSISESEVRSLGTQDWMVREYYRATPGAVPVGLYIAYFPQQRTGTTMHSPLHCIPGAGWQIASRNSVAIAVPPFLKPIRVNQVVFQKEEKKDLVLYWYLEQGTIEESEFRGALMTLWNGIWHGRTDGSLVRISCPITSTTQAAFQLEQQFIQAAYPVAISDFLPARPAIAEKHRQGGLSLVSKEVH